MSELARGANIAIDDGHLTLSVLGVRPGTVDLMVFQLDDSQRVRADDDFVFFNQPISREGAVRLDGPDRIAVDLNRIPSAIVKLTVAVALDDAVAGSLATIPGLGVVLEQSAGTRVAAPALGLTSERAAILLEVYRRNGAWKVRNVSAGWDAGLPALVVHHGVEVADQRPALTSAPPAPVPSPPPAPVPVSLAKITLDKARPTVVLAKSGEAAGIMRINLNWSRGAKKGLFGRLLNQDVDLDLACLYELKDGSKGVVQALGNSFGRLDRPPYIKLDGDDRNGSASGGENLHINLAHLDRIKRVLIFAYIYEGAPNWSAADGVVTLYPPAGPPVEVRLESGDDRAISCAIAMIENKKGDLTVTRKVEYINGAQDAVSRAYRFGLKWTPGAK